VKHAKKINNEYLELFAPNKQKNEKNLNKKIKLARKLLDVKLDKLVIQQLANVKYLQQIMLSKFYHAKEIHNSEFQKER